MEAKTGRHFMQAHAVLGMRSEPTLRLSTIMRGVSLTSASDVVLYWLMLLDGLLALMVREVGRDASLRPDHPIHRRGKMLGKFWDHMTVT